MGNNQMWTVARYSNGNWETGGKPEDYDDTCEIFIIEGNDRTLVKKKAQGCRSKLRQRDKQVFSKLKAGDDLGHFGGNGIIVEQKNEKSVTSSGGDLFTLDDLRKMRMRYEFKTGLFTVALIRGSVR